MSAVEQIRKEGSAVTTYTLPLKPECEKVLFHHFETELEGARKNSQAACDGLDDEKLDCFVAGNLSAATVDAANAAEQFNDVVGYVADLEEYARHLLSAVQFFQSRCSRRWSIAYKPLCELPRV